MERSTFEKIANDLKAFPAQLDKLHMYKDGEPLLNPALAWMVAMAVRLKIAKSVELTTNGTLLSAEKAHELLDAGLHRIRISVQPGATGARQDERAASLYSRSLANVRRLREERDRRGAPLEIHVKSIDFGRDDPLLARFYDDFGPIADTVHLDSAMGWSGSSSVDLTLASEPDSDMSGATPLRSERIVCPQPFYSLAINHDGEVSACCVDWSRDVLVGNVCEHSLSEIWQGDRLRALRLLHLRGRRSENPGCRNCQYVHGASPAGDLDGHRSTLERIYG